MRQAESEALLARRHRFFLLLAIALSLSVLSWLRPIDASDPDVSLINAERIQRGIPTLKEDSGLDSCALAHSRAMAQRGDIYHDLSQTAYRCAGKWTAYGENVGSGTTLLAIHNAYMNSSEHRRNILCSCFAIVGAGEVTSGGIVYNTEIFEARAAHTTPRPTPTQSRRATVVPPRPTPKPRPKPKPPKPPQGNCVVVSMLLRMRQFQ